MVLYFFLVRIIKFCFNIIILTKKPKGKIMLQLDDPQSILKHLIENEKLTSFRPEDIIKQINLAKRPEESELAQENNLHLEYKVLY